jgi:hypothetical protein
MFALVIKPFADEAKDEDRLNREHGDDICEVCLKLSKEMVAAFEHHDQKGFRKAYNELCRHMSEEGDDDE